MKIYELITKGKISKLSRVLSEMHFDVNQVVDGSRTPLVLACEHDQFEIVRLLVESGADVNLSGYAGQTPLHIAVDAAIDPNCGHKLGRRVDNAPVDTIVYLLWKGADPLRQADNGESPLDWAKKYGADKIVDLLEHFQ